MTRTARLIGSGHRSVGTGQRQRVLERGGRQQHADECLRGDHQRPSRLEREAALFAERSDVTEELTRLNEALVRAKAEAAAHELAKQFARSGRAAEVEVFLRDGALADAAEPATLTPDADARVRASVLTAFVAGRLQRFARSGFRRAPSEQLGACIARML